MEENDDLSIEDLLNAVSHIQTPKRKVKSQYDSSVGYTPTQLEKREAFTLCKCGKEFKGLMTCVVNTENIYENYQMPWCPFCVQDHMEEWFGHYLRMESVEVVN